MGTKGSRFFSSYLVFTPPADSKDSLHQICVLRVLFFRIMSSGIKISQEIKDIYERINVNSKKKPSLRYAVFKFNDANDQIVLDKEVTPEEAPDYDQVVQELPPNDVRYLAYDVKFVTSKETQQTNRKVILVNWHPDTAPVKRKMLVSSTFNTLRTSLGNTKDYLEGDDLSEIDSTAAVSKLGGVSYVNN